MGKSKASRFRRALAGLASSEDQRDDEELQDNVSDCGAIPVCECRDRDVVTLAGTLRTITFSPRGGVPALEGELYDGSASITVIWLGRRRIAGIRPGVSIVVSGRIGMVDGARVMFNPRYEIQPSPAHA